MATAARYFDRTPTTVINRAISMVLLSLKKILKSISIPTLMRKKGMKMAFPTNSTRFINADVCGMSLLRAKPAKKAPIMASIPASSARSAAR